MSQQLRIHATIAALAVSATALSSLPALALDAVTYGTNWRAQAEHGGFYQAVADGTYEEYGLDVTIVQGGPQSPNRQLLATGRIDFYMGGTMDAFDAVKQGIPTINVAAIFQKNPQILLAHPDQGIEEFDDLAELETIFMGADGFITYFEWMKARDVGFRDEQYKPYQFNPGPFLADTNSAQQGYLTSEPYAIEQQTGWAPTVFLLDDEGYSSYSTMITTQVSLVEENPDLVQRFVDASIVGWYNYLYGDNAAANELIKADNPEMTDGQLAYSLEKLKEFGIIESGEALEAGIGCQVDERYKQFFDTMVGIGVLEASLDYTQAFTTDFVCKGVGMDLKPEQG